MESTVDWQEADAALRRIAKERAELAAEEAALALQYLGWTSEEAHAALEATSPHVGHPQTAERFVREALRVLVAGGRRG